MAEIEAALEKGTPAVAVLPQQGTIWLNPQHLQDGEEAIVVRTMMFLSLSYDHRAVDGAPANGFLYRIRELLEAAEFEL